MSRGYFILKGREVVPTDDIKEWALALEQTYIDRTHWVAETTIGPWIVSTIFLGLDFSLAHEYGGPPHVFETMIRTAETFPTEGFEGKIEESPEFANYQTRCATYDEAEAMHKVACEQAFAWVDRMADAMPQMATSGTIGENNG